MVMLCVLVYVVVMVYCNFYWMCGVVVDLCYFGGFVLVMEMWMVCLLKGVVVLWFEGVVEGIVLVSVIIDGLFGGMVEKNCDVWLLLLVLLVDGLFGC